MNSYIPDADRQVAARAYRCDNCSAELTYDATVRRMKCGHCGFVKDVPQEGPGQVVEHDLFQGLQQSVRRGLGTVVKVHQCKECGANVSFPESQTATKCTFCGSAQVLEQRENSNAIRPESLLPFAIDKKTANQFFGRWIGSLWFRPSDLAKMASVQEVNGVYVPFWTFDADVESRWRAERGYYYYEEESYTTTENGQTVEKTRRVQRTRWEDAWGQRRDFYDDLLVCASKGLPPDLADHFKTYNTKQLVPYQPGYLAGWRAEEYAIDLNMGWSTGQGRIQKDQEQRCSRDVGGDTQRSLSVANTFHRVTFKHVLLPVWIAAYRYNGSVYRFLVNGQTGEVVGKAPWSWLKIMALVLTIVALIVGIALIASHSGGK